MKIQLVHNRIPHHASHSGYAQIHRYLQDLVPVENLHSVSGPAPILRWVWDRLIDRSETDWYNTGSLSLEIATGWKLLRRSHEIYHILYGEDTFRYLGSLGGIARLKKSKIVCSYHQPAAIFEKVVRHKESIRKLDAVIAVSTGQAAYFASFLEPSRVFFVPHGVDTTFYHPVPRPAGDRVRCLCVGQWLRDYDMLKSVAQRLGARDPRLSFTVITSAEAAIALRDMGNLVAATGVSEEDLLRAYQRADIFVLPLTDCTANNALLEALACGLPVVTTSVGGIADYVDSGCAIAVPRGDLDRMCDAVVALADDEELRKRMAAHGRRRSLEFDWRKIAGRVLDVYSAVA
ncbi:MAG TPA: glycosyltransferase family 4 protein [Bryobacteraceae bacterium]|nr:glycosyltransferase family 4 protein [Bryobacteraceae bacterium]